MAKTKISQFDATAANNTDLNSISIAEGTAPSNINNAIRELMSQLADLNLGNEVLSTLKIDNLHLDGNTIITLDTNGDLNLTPNGTGSVTIAKVDINGGAIDGTPIGGASASTGAFSTLSASSTVGLGSSVTISGGNIDGVIGANTPAAITGTVITANTNFAGNLTGNVTGNIDGIVGGSTPAAITGTTITANTKFVGALEGNVTAASGTSTFNNVTINGTLDMDSTTSQTITGLATPSGSTDAATKGYVDTEVSGLVDSAPATLNTLNELAAALGDDANYATTTTNSIAAKLPLAGGTMTGDINANSNTVSGLKAPSGANDATTKTYVDTADALKLNLSGGTLSGNLAMGSNKVTGLDTPTATGDATTKGYVDGILGSATAAATSASAAATSATASASSATASANSATASASSATSAAASYDSFDDRYLGAKGSAPTVDNDGDALLTGALYFNTSSNQLFVWTSGDAWTQAAFTASGFLSGSNNLSDVANAGTSRTNLGLAIGTNVQAFDADLSALAGLTSAADKGIQFTGSGTAGTYDLTSAGKALLDDADAAAQRTTLGLGTAATTASSDYATAAQGTKADNAAAKASNLSDLASASTARTNLGLGSVATLTAGTSANNAVQLDSNAKLPAVDGSQLTGISGGTDQIDMVIGSGSDAVSVGHVVTRESNGETKKVKKTTSTANYSVSVADQSTSVSGGALVGSPSPHYYGASLELCGSHDGRFLVGWFRGWANYDISLQSFYHTGSGSWTQGQSINTGHSHSGGQKPHPRMRFVKNCNEAAGGTFFFFYMRNGGGYVSEMRFIAATVASNGDITQHGSIYTEGNGAASGGSVYSGDTTIIDCSTDDEVVCIDAGTKGGKRFVGEWKITYNSGTYSASYIGGCATTNSNYVNSSFTSGYDRYTRVAYDFTNNAVFVIGVDNQRKLTIMKATPNSGDDDYTFVYASNGIGSELHDNGVIDQGYEYRDITAENGHGQVFFSIMNYRAGYSNNRWQVYAYDISASTYSSSNWNRFIYQSPDTTTNVGCIPIHYDHLFKKLFIPSNGTSFYTSSSYNNLQVYTFSGITHTLESNLSTGSFDGSSGSRYSKYGMWNMVDTISLASLTDAKAGRWFQLAHNSATGWNSGSLKFKSGTIPHSITSSTTNKTDAFGFAQKAGNAGDTISVLPFDSESIEQNQTSLTHNSKYYVTSTGTLSTATTPDGDIASDPDNPLVGQAINTTFLRLPTKSISGSSASSDTSKIFCGAVDLRETASQSNFTLSKPSSLNASDIRSYVIEWYGIMTSTSSDYYVLQMKPYNSGSSVMSGTFYGTGFSYYYGNHGNFSNNHSTYLNLCYLGGESYNGTASATRASTNINYSPSFSGQAVYENNINHASLNYHAYVRVGNNANYMKHEWWTGGANNSANVSNYADSFYFEPRTGNWTEGVVSLYAITK